MKTVIPIPGRSAFVVLSEERVGQPVLCGTDQKTSARRQHELAWELTYEALKPYVGEKPRIVFGSHGKPYLADDPWLTFNLSHCPVATAVVIELESHGMGADPMDVGIDVERRFLWKENLARHIAHPNEYAALITMPKEQRASALGSLWSRKESYLKLTGEGFSADPKTLQLWTPHVLSEQLTQTESVLSPSGRVTFYELQNERYSLVVCLHAIE